MDLTGGHWTRGVGGAWLATLVGVLGASQPAQAGGVQGAFSEVRQVTTNRSNQLFPRISGDNIVWEDWRSANPAASNPDVDVYLYNIPSGITRQLTSGNQGQLAPDVGPNHVVWEDDRRVDANNFEVDIRAYRISDGANLRVTTETNDAAASSPRISGSTVVWQDDRNSLTTGDDLFWYNFNTQQTGSYVIPNDQNRPVIDGTTIVWEDNRNDPLNSQGQKLGTNWDLFAMPIGGAERPVTTAPALQQTAEISGAAVVWEDTRNASPNDMVDVYGTSGTGERLLAGGLGDQKSPVVSGNLYVYAEVTPPPQPCRLWVADLNTGRRTILVEDDDTGHVGEEFGNVQMDLDGNRLVWMWTWYDDNGTPNNPNDDFEQTDIYYGVINPIVNHAPAAVIEGPAIARVLLGSPVTLNGCTSSDQDGDPLTYTWRLGSGGGPVIGTSCSLTRPSPANVTVENYVLQGSGGTLSSQAYVSVSWQTPVNLSVTSLTYTPAQPKVQEQITYTATVRNVGNLPASATQLRFEFQCSGSLLFGWPQVTVPALAVGQEVSVSAAGSCPDPGTFSVTAVADSTNITIPQPGVGGNKYLTVSVVISPQPAYPDLTITSITASPNPPRPNQSFRISAVVANQGTALSAYGIGGGFAQWIIIGAGVFDVPLPPLAPGQSTTLIWDILASQVVADGRWVVSLSVDSQGQITESNELNNNYVTQFVVASCYVLSAAYGSPQAPEIQALWALHHRLVPDWNAPWHQAALAWYDRVGPRVAAFLHDKPYLKALVRAIVTPAARLAQWWLERHR